MAVIERTANKPNCESNCGQLNWYSFWSQHNVSSCAERWTMWTTRWVNLNIILLSLIFFFFICDLLKWLINVFGVNTDKVQNKVKMLVHDWVHPIRFYFLLHWFLIISVKQTKQILASLKVFCNLQPVSSLIFFNDATPTWRGMKTSQHE